MSFISVDKWVCNLDNRVFDKNYVDKPAYKFESISTYIHLPPLSLSHTQQKRSCIT